MYNWICQIECSLLFYSLFLKSGGTKKCWLSTRPLFWLLNFKTKSKDKGRQTMAMKKSGNDVLYYNCNSGTWAGNLIGPSQLSQ